MRSRKPKHVIDYIDRHGKPRIYLRRPGRKQVPLPCPMYSPEFWTAYHAAMADEPPPVGATTTKPGSVSDAVVRFYSSAEWKRLAASTQTNYRRIYERFRTEHGDKRLAALETRHVNAMIDKQADKPVRARHFRMRLSQLFEFAIGAGLVDSNPVLRAKTIKHKTRGYRTWTEGDIEAYRQKWPVGTPQRLALELLLYTGLRRSDVVRLGWQHVRGGRIEIATVKSQERTELSFPVHRELWSFLRSCPRDADAFLMTVHGKPRSAKAFTNWVREAAHDAGLPSDSSPHGLRKAACRRLAEAGCTTRQIMAITGHLNESEVSTYVMAAEKRLMADMAMRTVASAFDVGKMSNPDDGLDETIPNYLIAQGKNMEMARSTGVEPVFSA